MFKITVWKSRDFYFIFIGWIAELMAQNFSSVLTSKSAIWLHSATNGAKNLDKARKWHCGWG